MGCMHSATEAEVSNLESESNLGPPGNGFPTYRAHSCPTGHGLDALATSAMKMTSLLIGLFLVETALVSGTGWLLTRLIKP